MSYSNYQKAYLDGQKEKAAHPHITESEMLGKAITYVGKEQWFSLETQPLRNGFMDGLHDDVAAVGTGITLQIGADKYPGTIQKITPSRKTIFFSLDSSGSSHIARFTKNGWRWDGYRLLIGKRQEYRALEA